LNEAEKGDKDELEGTLTYT